MRKKTGMRRQTAELDDLDGLTVVGNPLECLNNSPFQIHPNNHHSHVSKSRHFFAAGFRQRCSYFLARELNVVSVSAKLDLFNPNHLKDNPRKTCDLHGRHASHGLRWPTFRYSCSADLIRRARAASNLQIVHRQQ